MSAVALPPSVSRHPRLGWSTVVLLGALGCGALLVGCEPKVPIVDIGATFVLADATWPSSALGTRIGTVESAGPLDSNPLRRSVIVRMDCDPTRLGEDVIVKVRDVEGGRR